MESKSEAKKKKSKSVPIKHYAVFSAIQCIYFSATTVASAHPDWAKAM